MFVACAGGAAVPAARLAPIALAALLVLSMTCARPAHAAPYAAGGGKGGPDGASSAGAGRSMTRDEIRGCLLRRETVQRDVGDNRVRLHAMEAESAALMDEMMDMAESMRTLDLADPAAVSRHNARVQAHDAKVAEHNEHTARFNENTLALQVAQASLMKDCLARPVLAEDERAVLRELGLTRRLSQAPKAP